MTSIRRTCLLGVFILFCQLFGIAKAAVKLPRLISDGMVLQRDVPLNIWGWADPGEKINVEFQGKKFQAKTDKQGNWRLQMPAYCAGGPWVMKINDHEIHDVLMGDVWICSGQSNMELPIRRVLDLYQSEIDQVNNPNIRQFRCSSRNDFDDPQKDYKDGAWLSATPANILDFSAVAYFFAAELNKKYSVPVGLINTAIGGSPAESWLSDIPAAKYRDEWMVAQARIDSIKKAKKAVDGDIHYNWFEELNKVDPGVGKWSKGNVDVSDWQVVSMPGYWSEKGVQQKTGSLWFAKEFEVPDSMSGQKAVLRLGRIIDSDSAFINGQFVGTISYQYPPRIYKVPSGVLKAGMNQLMVRVISQGARGGFVEEKPYELRMDGLTIDLTGDWKYHPGSDVKSQAGIGDLQFKPGGLFNGLISPSLNYNVKGVIWYQGESNIAKSKDYPNLFQNLITDWRAQYKNGSLPFLFVQLANLGRPNKQVTESGWAEVREAQRLALTLPNTGMAVAFDLGEWNDIHPLNKKEVGHRLALEASRVAFGDSLIVSQRPLYESMQIDGNCINLTFTSVGSGLYANNLLDGFQIAGADGRYVWANAVVLTHNQVKVWSPAVPEPKMVRYAWEDNPSGANLKNKEGLPASSFTAKK